MRTYLCVYLGAAFAALVITPIVIRIARAMKILDLPGVRRVHSTPVPRLGGLAIAAAMLGMTFCVLLLDNVIGEAFRNRQTQLIALLGGAVFLLVVGLIDDVRGVRARTKLLSQLAAAAVVCSFGIRINSIAVEGLFTLRFGWLAWPITIFWIAGVINAVNLIDGLDGLTAGISAIACGVVAVFAVHSGQPLMAVLMLAMLGSLSGFLFYNFNPARIFMGDGGTHFLGFILGAGSVMSATKSSTLVGLALPALALGIPIFDTLFAILRRFLERRSLFAPDRSHIHHRLLAMGLHQRHAVMIMYAATLIAAGLGLFMLITRDAATIMVFACVLLLLVLMFRAVGSVRLREALAGARRNFGIARQERLEKHEYEDADLLLREADSFETWWRAVCAAAEEMELMRVAIPVGKRDGSSSVLVWNHPKLQQLAHESIRMTVPVRDRRSGPSLHVEVHVYTDGSLESAGRRLSLFTRLIDEHSLASLGNLAKTNRTAPLRANDPAPQHPARHKPRMPHPGNPTG